MNAFTAGWCSLAPKDKSSAARALLMLKKFSKKQEETSNRILETVRTPPSSNDESDENKDHPIADDFYFIDEDRTMQERTDIAMHKLLYLYSVVKRSMQPFFERRGRKYVDTLFDIFSCYFISWKMVKPGTLTLPCLKANLSI